VVAEQSGNLIAPYKPGPDGQLRPYLLLTLLGVEPGLEVEILGLVDTGADRSVLPIDFAEELGYTVDDLEPREVSQVEGSASAWVAKKPCQAFVDGLPDTTFEIEPVFVAGLNALWGRADLMMNFKIGVSERDRQLTLEPN
jgi:Aspartyl protease